MRTVAFAALVASAVAFAPALSGGMPPAHAGARTVKHFLEPHPLRYIHIFGSKPPPSAR